jgi:RNA-directed DNA polymerase
MTTYAADAAVGQVNGPEGHVLDWDAIDWRACQDEVARLRRRIFKASRDGNRARVRNLQKLMLASRSNALLSVRQVSQRNAGRLTPGIDHQVALTSQDRAELATRIIGGQLDTWRAMPVRRVHIPKAGDRTKLRPLGIPVIMDRCLQAVVRNALEPEWEARFEARVYGFRPGRGCHDAIEAIFTVLAPKAARRVWILDADLKAAFDRIDHDHLMSTIGSFPARGMIRQWLKAGVVERGQFFASEQGTPQGGVISPCLMNIALHGLEEAAGVSYDRLGADGAITKRKSPVVVRYADDLVVLCHSSEQAEQVKAALAEWLTPRGLGFNEDKTGIVHVDDGFDFLGFNVRRYHGKLLIKPSKAAITRIKQRLRDEIRALRGSNALAVIATINPIVRGWSAYYRTAVSSEAFASLDDYLWRLTYRWALWQHPNKSRRWVSSRYFGRFNRARNDRWVFGDRDSGAYMRRFSWTLIVRHTMVAGTASPDDPALTTYWAERRRHPRRSPLDARHRRLLREQNEACARCGDQLLNVDHLPQSPQDWERWHRSIQLRPTVNATRAGHGPADEIRLVHTQCRSTAAAQLLSPDDASRTCLSRGAGKARMPGSEGASAR